MTPDLSQPTVGIASLRRPRPARDLEILAAVHLPAKSDWIRRGFGAHAVGLVVSGRGEYRMGDGPAQPVGPGTQIAVFPGPQFFYGPEARTTWEEYYVIFSGSGVGRLIEAGWFPVDGVTRPLAGIGPLVEHFRELIRTLARAGAGDADRAALMTERLLLDMFHSRAASRQARPAATQVEAILAHCHEHFSSQIDFVQMAEQHEMSYSYLRQQVRKTTGLPPHQYVIRLRCECAQKLLSETDLPVHEIGGRVGIRDAYTFSRTFTRCVGMSPARYRKTIGRLGPVP